MAALSRTSSRRQAIGVFGAGAGFAGRLMLFPVLFIVKTGPCVRELSYGILYSLKHNVRTGGGMRKNKRFHFRLPAADAAILKAMAEQIGCSVSEFVRRAALDEALRILRTGREQMREEVNSGQRRT